ncbi:cytochrome P450 [Lineolata rhizophorae]|uniref:Cytochrome P450 n=1 Tax=Lineolata rhizophorae TaxID=578093 RepID=A0A6A6NVH3_9PEZI|nr:cytochrome P450 [Lineolata rhizophorae]
MISQQIQLENVHVWDFAWFACGAAVLLWILKRMLDEIISPLRKLPGPFMARFSRLWYLKQVWKGNFEQTNIALHRKYGPIVRITPNEYSIDDVEAVRNIYGHGTNFIKSPWYYASGRPGQSPSKDLFTDRDAKRHAANRRKVAALYSTTNLMKMEPAISECTDLLTERFLELAKSGAVVNMQHYLQCFAFDVIGLVTVGNRFGFLDNGQDKLDIFSDLHAYLRYCATVGIFSEWHRIVFKIFQLLSSKGMANMVKFTNNQIQERLAADDIEGKPTSNDDFLGRILAMHQEAPDKFSMENVFTVCLTNIGAGSDTTSVSLSAILHNLIVCPDSMRKLRAEIDEKARSAEISNPVTYQESLKLPYLQAVIKEGLRMHPATGLPLGRVVPQGGATIAGSYFPEGTVVGINTWVAHSNKHVFGEDAEVFRPERWLESEERTARMERYHLAFGHGSRTCIGKNISLMEISKLIPQLVRTFDFALANSGEKLETDNVWFVKQKNFYCKVAVRSK